MKIEFHCPFCGKRLKADKKHLGIYTKCPVCNNEIELKEDSTLGPILENSKFEEEIKMGNGTKKLQTVWIMILLTILVAIICFSLIRITTTVVSVGESIEKLVNQTECVMAETAKQVELANAWGDAFIPFETAIKLKELLDPFRDFGLEYTEKILAEWEKDLELREALNKIEAVDKQR
jgi:phage FluMu protein Com